MAPHSAERITTSRASHQVIRQGAGSPPVVFVNALGSPLQEWDLVAPEVSATSQVVRYERRDTLDHFGHVPTAQEAAEDLAALLDVLDLREPVILVGHSVAGLVLRAFASAHPTRVAGLVFVDASHEALMDAHGTWPVRVMYRSLLTAFRSVHVRRFIARRSGYGGLDDGSFSRVVDAVGASRETAWAEFRAIPESVRLLRDNDTRLPGVPVRILIAGRRTLGYDNVPRMKSAWQPSITGLQDAEITVIEGAGHHINLEAPASVIDAVRELQGQIGASAPSPGEVSKESS
jgi:pimeloyl-ACP methyl ester carboxylesterase